MSRSTEAVAITAPFLVLATVTLYLRLYTRLAVLKNAGIEDILVFIAWVSLSIALLRPSFQCKDRSLHSLVTQSFSMVILIRDSHSMALLTTIRKSNRVA